MVTASANMAVRESFDRGPSAFCAPRCKCGVSSSINSRKPMPSRKPKAAGSTLLQSALPPCRLRHRKHPHWPSSEHRLGLCGHPLSRQNTEVARTHPDFHSPQVLRRDPACHSRQYVREQHCGDYRAGEIKIPQPELKLRNFKNPLFLRSQTSDNLQLLRRNPDHWKFCSL